jgi:hypothetical protein
MCDLDPDEWPEYLLWRELALSPTTVTVSPEERAPIFGLPQEVEPLSAEA